MRLQPPALLFALVAAASLAGCGEDNALTGVYAGTVRAPFAGTTVTLPVRVSLSQSGSSLSGSFEATDPDGVPASGSVNGSVSGSRVTLAFTPTTQGSCGAQLDGSSSGSRISGSLQILCPGQAPVQGTMELTKQ